MCCRGVWRSDPGNPCGIGPCRAQCYYHARFLKIDPQKDLTNP